MTSGGPESSTRNDAAAQRARGRHLAAVSSGRTTMSWPSQVRGHRVGNVGRVAPLTVESIIRAPKVLLHDHLDGGLRPETVLELAEEHGYRQLPESEPKALERWFRQAADSGSLV